jgi:ribosomal protein S18 acetylase RimI-like enzyme
MTDGLNSLVRLERSQIKPAGAMLARAFYDDPFSVYLIPDGSRRGKLLPYIFEFSTRFGVLYGEVYTTSPNLEGVAVWLPSEKADMTLWRVMRNGGLSLLPKLGWDLIQRLPALNSISSLRKRHAPFRHWYLLLLGVDPLFQGKGYAGNLLRAMLARLDEEHLPCYLETQNGKNVSIYQHYGFKVVAEVLVPGTEIALWAMLRGKAD